jgi:deoxycytidylate deaminase
MTCAKHNVVARLMTKDGKVYVGTNACRAPQEFCPRLPGDDYFKCFSICKQPMHAEVDAIWQAQEAGSEPRGGTMYVFHTHICQHCQAILDRYEIEGKCVS